MELAASKFNMMFGGQLGSEGKGLLANYIASTNHIDIAVSNASSNAGHTFYWQLHSEYSVNKHITKHLPISGVINKRSTIYLCAGSIINPKLLLKEIDESDIDPNNLYINPRAAIITDEDIENEMKDNGVKTIASTMSGVGSALVRKINRKAALAWECKELKQFIKFVDLEYYMDKGCTVLMEVPQGMDLSLNHGLSYPYCTSRDVTPASAMNDAMVHPKYIGKVIVAIRTMPIRVGNVIENGVEKGNSGPFHNDSIETTWEQLGIETEYTTRTNRVRRVASFSFEQYSKMLKIYQPDYVFLNFCNYLTIEQLRDLLSKLPEVTHLGFGAKIENIDRRN